MLVCLKCVWAVDVCVRIHTSSSFVCIPHTHADVCTPNGLKLSSTGQKYMCRSFLKPLTLASSNGEKGPRTHLSQWHPNNSITTPLGLCKSSQKHGQVQQGSQHECLEDSVLSLLSMSIHG